MEIMALRNNFLKLLARKMERENRIITEAQAAREIGVAKQTVNTWVHQKQHPTRELENVCRYLNCGIGELLELDPPVEPINQ